MSHWFTAFVEQDEEDLGQALYEHIKSDPVCNALVEYEGDNLLYIATIGEDREFFSINCWIRPADFSDMDDDGLAFFRQVYRNPLFLDFDYTNSLNPAALIYLLKKLGEIRPEALVEDEYDGWLCTVKDYSMYLEQSFGYDPADLVLDQEAYQEFQSKEQERLDGWKQKKESSLLRRLRKLFGRKT